MNTADGGCLLGVLAPRPCPTQQPVGTSAGTPQDEQPTWWVSTNRLSKDFLSPQPPLDMTLDMALPPEGQDTVIPTNDQAPAFLPWNPTLAFRLPSLTRVRSSKNTTVSKPVDSACPQWVRLYPETSRALLLPASRWRHFRTTWHHIQMCQKPPPSTKMPEMSSGIPGPCSETTGNSCAC